jgi:citrate synthase
LPYVVNLDSVINMTTHLDASRAAARLGVGRATLYAYVSRGQIRSRAVPGQRTREYSEEDIERLAQQKAGRRDPGSVARRALAIDGLPVLSSSLTLIESGRLYYRGQDAIALSREARFEAVAALLWGGPVVAAPEPFRPTRTAQRALAALHFAAAGQCHLATVQARDRSAYDLSPTGVRRSGARILSELAALACGFRPQRPSTAENLAVAWGLRGRSAHRALDAALTLCADHELNVSAFTARAIASAGATPYMAVSGALAALSGHRHGGMAERVLELLRDTADPEWVIAERLRRGETVAGFGHPLYPDGDPRALRLLELCPKGSERLRMLRFAAAAERLLEQRPNLDFGLVALSRSLDLPRQAPFVLFSLGRSAGWIAHAIEQYETGQLIRPRARYTGLAPSTVTRA